MQIVIPMSGFGERFRRAGYTVPKPLIAIEGKPIVSHVVDMFPGETDVLFICNEEHLADPAFRMREILEAASPSATIVGIAAHRLGPVHAVLQAASHIRRDGPVVVNYCDFTCFWDWSHFRRRVADTGCDGAIPAYRGFHPHSLGTTNYAYMRERDGWVLDIQEKEPYTDNRMQEYASSGTYYFASGALMLDAFAATEAQKLTVGGEHYVSLSYKPLLAEGRRVLVYPLQHFMQWGTPEDVHEYEVWSDAFRNLIDPAYARGMRMDGTTLIPMAGLGERFSREGYTLPKPMIPVSGRPMVAQATDDLPRTRDHLFVLRGDMPGLHEIQETLEGTWPGMRSVVLDGPTDGQARTALLGWEALDAAAKKGPITIAACDNGALFRGENLAHVLTETDVDVVVWVARGYPNAARNPRMYGWLRCDGDRVVGASIKTPLADPAHDPIVTGTFTFRRGTDFARAVERMIRRDGRINGEFYIDSSLEDAIALGLDVRIMEIDSYLCWGTPNDLRTFEYWQSCFHKWHGHPYRLELDSRVAPEAIEVLDERYSAFSVE